ncbi:MAG: STAS domain-containing protein [Opitutales bacterium]|nr:STAS domain-containing protein [Opitutales bacterium]MCH8540303.1 STAS domain-containing protein [Opitutales bacterium]
MSEQEQPAFLVDAYSDPVIIKLNGRISFLNCGPFRDFMNRLIPEGKRNFIIDFADCTGMDSTFLGAIAGAALDLRKQDEPGKVFLFRLGTRNLELVKNLGLHRLLHVDEDGEQAVNTESLQKLEGEDASAKSEVENAKMVLEAHENLIKADEDNRSKFQDVISFLKNQVAAD